MDIRSHSVTTGSGPGRGATRGPGRPGADHRARRRHRSRRTTPQYRRDAPEGTRARATALFGGLPAREPVVPEPEPPAEPGPAPGSAPDTPGRSGVRERPLPWPARWRLALGERLPLWVSLRCGADPRTLAALAVLLVAAVGFAGHHFWTGRPETVRVPSAEPAGAAGPAALPSTTGEPDPVPPVPGAAQSAGDRAVVVDVAGKVRDPGIHRLPAGSRVEDALKAAGGVRPGTDTAGLNRARLLLDGEQIVVGGPAPAAAAGGGAAGTPGPAPGGAAAGPVSLSTATLEQLDGLPGVGPVLARRILEHRDRQGGFTSVDQLREVNGIGDRRFADLQPLVRP
ncbi:ComEA family DNA-binding protein [Streptomyces xinghaiensis]|nr:ComEA family DNA-binding protein [Streptomyces xinghaiensis]